MMHFYYCKRHWALIVSLFVFFLSLPAYAVSIQEVVSPKQGIHAWLVQNDTVPLITMQFSFKNGGTVQDPEGKDGLITLMSGLLDEGAGDFSSDVYSEKLDNIGAGISFSASADSLYGSLRVLSENRDDAFDLLALALSKPRFDLEPFERIRQQMITGIKASERDPNTIAEERFSKALFGNHPYARKTTEQTLMTITRDDLFNIHRKIFARDHLVISVVGDISPQELAPFLDRLFGDLPEKSDLIPIPDIKVALGETIKQNYDLSQTSITLAYPGISRKDPDYFAVGLVNTILGGGALLSSRLDQEVREKRGLAYFVASNRVNFDHSAGWIDISTTTRSDQTQEVLRIIHSEITRMLKDGPTKEELAQAKTYLNGSYILSLDNSLNLATMLTNIQKLGYDRDYFDKRVHLINAVTLEQAKAAAQPIFQATPAILLIGPQDDKDSPKH